MSEPAEPAAIAALLDVMRRLRDPVGGCPWDRAQTFATIAPYTIEEAYEVASAIEAGDLAGLKDELGDLLLQVVFHAQIADEDGAFGFADVAAAITAKMIARHPHVFAGAEGSGHGVQWEARKAAERAARAAAEGRPSSALDGVANALPALSRAAKLQKRAARVGFDWPDLAPVIAKVEEELGEVMEAHSAADGNDRQEVALELGDLLFACVNLARHLEVDPEAALRAANAKFERRFLGIEAIVRGNGQRTEDRPLDELEQHWNTVKRGEKGNV